jgi:TolB-like protein/Flp pilus assembly protein TadD
MRALLPRVIRFGSFELDTGKAQLRKHGVRLRIQDQPFCILMALLERPGEIISREELVKRVWPSGTFVDFEHSLNAAVNRLRQVLCDSLENPRYIETVTRRGYCFVGQVESQTQAADLQSLAVLPFTNLSHNGDDDYFCDGLAVEIINGLTKIPGLRVIGRASSSLFRDRTLLLKEIAERLKVTVLLDGSFQRSGNRIRVAAQLVNGADENCLWSERYDRALTDLFDVQEDIAQSIVSTLKLTMGGERLIRQYTRNEDAHLFYLKGTFHLHKWGLDSMERLTEYMRRVVVIEPAYAPAWVELAHLAFGQAMTNCVPAAKVLPVGIEAAQRAVSADPDLAEAHGILGFLKGLYEYEWAAALDQVRLAIELNGAAPSVHYYQAMLLISLGRLEDALSELHQSLELDPFSVLVNAHLCRLYTICGDYVQAIAYGNRAVEVGPHHYPGLGRLGEAHVWNGDVEEGLTLLKRCRSAAPAEGWYTATLAGAYCRAGHRVEAEKILLEVEQKSHEAYVPSAVLAFTAAALGHVNQAFKYFDRALADRDGILFLVSTERALEPIRREARYRKLLRRMNLSTAAVETDMPSGTG